LGDGAGQRPRSEASVLAAGVPQGSKRVLRHKRVVFCLPRRVVAVLAFVAVPFVTILLQPEKCAVFTLRAIIRSIDRCHRTRKEEVHDAPTHHFSWSLKIVWLVRHHAKTSGNEGGGR